MVELMQEEERAIREAAKMIIDRLSDFDGATRSRILRTAQTFFGLEVSVPTRVSAAFGGQVAAADARSPTFSSRDELPPKDFLLQKRPATDVERVVCLAYYLANYRETPHFKTLDITKLNTEAAQVKFSNAAYAVGYAVKSGLLASAGKKNVQLSAIGERYVDALPDRAAAKEVLASMRPRRRRRKTRNGKPAAE